MEIPGYKWDPEKKRYFKILSTGQLPGGNYTVSAVAQKERCSRRNYVRKRAEKLANESPVRVLPATVFEFKRLGRGSKQVYVGSADELLTSIHLTAQRKLVTGSRNGVIAYNGRKSEPGRSIVGITDLNETPAIASVDQKFGSTVATPYSSIQLRHEYVTSICAVGSSLAIGSQRGTRIWDLSNSETSWDAWPLGSVSTLTNISDQVILLGTKAGVVESLDLREASTNRLAEFENQRAVTNLGVLSGDNKIVATGLEDEMWMYDLRDTRVPVHEFSGYENWSMSRHGFALNANRTAIAVAMDNGRIQVYDGVTGNSLGLVSSGAVSAGSGLPSSNLEEEAGPLPVSSLAWNEEGLFIAQHNSVYLRPGKAFEHVETAMNTEGSVAKIHSALNSQFLVY